MFWGLWALVTRLFRVGFGWMEKSKQEYGSVCMFWSLVRCGGGHAERAESVFQRCLVTGAKLGGGGGCDDDGDGDDDGTMR